MALDPTQWLKVRCKFCSIFIAAKTKIYNIHKIINQKTAWDKCCLKKKVSLDCKGFS